MYHARTPLIVIAGIMLFTTPIALGGDVDKSWLERLPKDDWVCLNSRVGDSLTGFTDDITFSGTEPLQWDQLRGQVIVVQSWTSRTPITFKRLKNTAKTLTKLAHDDVTLLALHTPEGLRGVNRFLERQEFDGPVIIDHSGRLCDQLGIYKRPVIVVIDRSGVIRYAGLNQRGLEQAVTLLIEEPYTPAPETTSPEPEPAIEVVEFPPLPQHEISAKDLGGKTAPNMKITKWLNNKPDLEGKVVLVDFWATWCAPCRASIPHTNKLADRFRDDVVCIGLSDETPSAFETGMRKQKLKFSDFHYTLALDGGQMSRKASVRGIPHVIIMSSDWVVRWQGHPTYLTEEILGKIVAANNSLDKSVVRAGSDACSRWSNRRR